MKLTKSQIGGTPNSGVLIAIFLFAFAAPFVSSVSSADGMVNESESISIDAPLMVASHQAALEAMSGTSP